MVPKRHIDNELKDSPEVAAAQGRTWTTLPIAVTPEMKQEFVALAHKMHLAPSQYGRMLIADAIGRSKAA